ncbi:hypothetical protein BH11BAC2_BH11BAC2_18390 [soil metagenome]
MLEFIKEKKEFLILVMIWMITGALASDSALFFVPAGIILLKYKGMYTEIILSLLVMCYFSDNRQPEFEFAGKVKDITLVLASAFVFLDPKQFKEKSAIYLPFVPFFILAFILSFNNPYDPVISFQKTLSFLLMMAVIPNYFLKLLRENGEKFLRDMIWFGTLLYLMGYVAIFVMGYDWTFLVGRYSGILGNPNGQGTFSTLFFLLIAVSRYHYPKMFTRNELIFILAAVFLSILLSQSRNCMFSILIFLFFSRFYKISYWVGFVIVLVVAMLYQVISENLPIILTNLGLAEYMRVEHLDDGSGRLIAWNYAIEQIQNHDFLFGRGFAYEEELFFQNRHWLSDLGHQGGVHNTYLALWLNTGLVGLILYLIAFFRNFILAARKSYMAIPTMFAILFSITFEAWFQASLNPFTIIALLIITLLQYVKNEAESTHPVL